MRPAGRKPLRQRECSKNKWDTGLSDLGHSNCNLSIFQTDFVTIFFKFSLCGLPFLITAGQGRKMGKRESSKKWMSLLRWFCHNFPPIFYPSYWGLQEINPNSQSSVKLLLFSVFSFTEKQNRWQFHGTLSFNLWHLQYSFLAYINLLLTPASWVWSLTDVSKSASIQKWHIGAPIFSGSLDNWTKVGQTLDMDKYWTFTFCPMRQVLWPIFVNVQYLFMSKVCPTFVQSTKDPLNIGAPICHFWISFS